MRKWHDTWWFIPLFIFVSNLMTDGLLSYLGPTALQEYFFVQKWIILPCLSLSPILTTILAGFCGVILVANAGMWTLFECDHCSSTPSRRLSTLLQCYVALVHQNNLSGLCFRIRKSWFCRLKGWKMLSTCLTYSRESYPHPTQNEKRIKFKKLTRKSENPESLDLRADVNMCSVWDSNVLMNQFILLKVTVVL